MGPYRGPAVGESPVAADIKAAVDAPDLVTADADHPRRERLYHTRTGGGSPLKVVVRYVPVPPDGTWAGEVVTAYPARDVKPGEEQLWP